MHVQDLTRAQCWRFLGLHRMGRLGCARDNRPYVVPLNFAIEKPWFFAFTTAGQKADYLKANPSVCLQFDDITSRQSWTSVVVDGRFEMLEDDVGQDHAHGLLEDVAWWEPGYVRTMVGGHLRPASPFYFRVLAEKISGRQGIPESWRR